MVSHRNRALIVLIGLFTLISGVLVWSFIFENQAFFEIGTHPVAIVPPPPPPSLPEIRSSDPSRGSVDSKAVTIVEFADYSCLYCRLMEPEIEQVVSDKSMNVRVVWRDLPVANENPDGLISALAGRCAAKQNRFWEMHDAMFASPRLDFASIRKIASGIQMDQTTFGQCVRLGQPMKDIGLDVALAKKNNITGSPTLFVGDQLVDGFVSTDELKAIIAEVRRRAP